MAKLDNTQAQFVYKWSQEIKECGYVCIPNILLENMGHLKITPSELAILLMIEKFRWYAVGEAYPSVKTLAKMFGCRPRHVTRILESLETKGLLRRNYRNHQSTVYEIDGLKSKLQSLATNDQERQIGHPPTDIFGIRGRL